MRIGSFEIHEPVPEFENPHVIASLNPWLNAGSVGGLTLSRLERHLGGADLGSLATPGTYFDFTRYRPTTYYENGQRRTNIPNTHLRYSTEHRDEQFIFLHMLEPHSFAEEYIDSIVEVLKYFNVRRFGRIGGMYDAVPHTRPLLVSGTLNGEPLTDVEGLSGPRRGVYQGPTSIMNLVGERATALGAENLSLMVRLPQYLQMEEDYAGMVRLLTVLSSLYDLPEEVTQSRRAIRQYERISAEVNRNPEVKLLVERLEIDYDARHEPTFQEEPTEQPEVTLPPLSPSIERFLGQLGGPDDAEPSR